jgi:AcrR family transcriptional regulator
VPRLLDTESRTNTVTNAVNDLLALHGASALTMRRIAAECRLSTAALGSHYGSREHMLRLAMFTTSAARLEHLGDQVVWEGATGLLPRAAGDDVEDDVVDARVWLAWLEMGRSHEWLQTAMTEHRQKEMALLARRYDYELTRTELVTVLALVDGLLVAVCDPVDPLRPAVARTILTQQLVVLMGGGGAQRA